MRLVSFSDGRAGVEIGTHILDIAKAASKFESFAGIPNDVRKIVSDVAAFEKLKAALSTVDDKKTEELKKISALVERAAVELTAPLEPLTIYAVGLNYTDHLEEMDTPTPSRPYSFVKATSGITGDGQPIILPEGADQMVDWEAEMAIVVGKTCYKVDEADAEKNIFGYMCANDISAREAAVGVLEHKSALPTIEQWALNLLGKQYPTFGPLGPSLVTADEVGDSSKLNIECRVNGQVMQKSNTSKMVFSPTSLISYLSQYQVLRPGDVILSGTMGGVGFGRNPQVFLKPGDIVEVEIEKVGVLKNYVKK